LPDLKSTVPSEPQEQLLVLLATLLPVALIDSGMASHGETDPKSPIRGESAGDPLASRQAVLCRFLV